MKRLLSLCLAVCVLFTMFVFPASVTAATESHKIMHMNACATSPVINADGIAGVIDDYGPDLIAFNEININPAAIGYHTMQRVAARGYAYYGLSDWAPGSHEDVNLKAAWTSFVCYKTSKYSVLASGTFSLSDNPSNPHAFLSTMDEDSKNNIEGRPRNCNWILIESKTTHDRFIFASAHLQRRTYTAAGLKILAEQLNILKAKYNCEVVCPGDMNTGPGSMTPATSLGYRITNKGTVTYPSSGGKIDNILYTSGFTASDYRVGAEYEGISDHLPQFVTMAKTVAENPYKITATVGANGKALINGTDVVASGINNVYAGAGTTVNVNVTPNSGYIVSSVAVGGSTVPLINNGDAATYQFTMPSADTSVTVNFKKNTYVPGVYEITSENSVNVCDAPMSENVIGTLPTGTRITALEMVNVYWAKIVFEGKIAYVSVSAAYAKNINTTAIAESDIVFDNQTNVDLVTSSGAVDTTISLTSDADSYMKLVASASTDPHIKLDYSNLGHLNASKYKYIVITARTSNTENTVGKLYLCPGSITSPTQSCVASVTWNTDGMWHDYVIDLSAVSAWTGNLNSIRFDYFDSTTVAGATFDLRSIKFYTSQPSTATVSTSKASYDLGEDIVINYSGLESYINTLQNQKPFVAFYTTGTNPGNGSAYMYAYVNKASGTLTFPNDAQGGSSGGSLASGTYKVWLSYDAYGSSNSYNFSNAYYAGSATSYDFTITTIQYTPPKYDVTTSITSGKGTVSLSTGATSDSYEKGDNVSYTITPAAGYKVSSITVGGISQIVLNSGETATYSFTMGESATTIAVVFGALTYDVVTNIVAESYDASYEVPVNYIGTTFKWYTTAESNGTYDVYRSSTTFNETSTYTNYTLYKITKRNDISLPYYDITEIYGYGVSKVGQLSLASGEMMIALYGPISESDTFATKAEVGKTVYFSNFSGNLTTMSVGTYTAPTYRDTSSEASIGYVGNNQFKWNSVDGVYDVYQYGTVFPAESSYTNYTVYKVKKRTDTTLDYYDIVNVYEYGVSKQGQLSLSEGEIMIFCYGTVISTDTFAAKAAVGKSVRFYNLSGTTPTMKVGTYTPLKHGVQIDANAINAGNKVTLSGGAVSGSYDTDSIVGYSITPATGYCVSKVVVYGKSQAILNNGAAADYNFTMQPAPANIAVTFAPIKFNVTASIVNDSDDTSCETAINSVGNTFKWYSSDDKNGTYDIYQYGTVFNSSSTYTNYTIYKLTKRTGTQTFYDITSIYEYGVSKTGLLSIADGEMMIALYGPVSQNDSFAKLAEEGKTVCFYNLSSTVPTMTVGTYTDASYRDTSSDTTINYVGNADFKWNTVDGGYDVYRPGTNFPSSSLFTNYTIYKVKKRTDTTLAYYDIINIYEYGVSKQGLLSLNDDEIIIACHGAVIANDTFAAKATVGKSVRFYDLTGTAPTMKVGTFTPVKYGQGEDITATAAGCTVTLADGNSVGDYAFESTVSFTVTPADGYVVSKIVVYGQPLAIINNGAASTYSFDMKAAPANIAITFDYVQVGDTTVVDKVGTDTASGANSAVVKIGSTVLDTIASIESRLNASSVTVTKNGVEVDAFELICTGMVVTADSATYTVVVSGDVDCDGMVTIADAAAAMAGLRGTESLSNASYDAAKEMSGMSGALSILDVMALLNAL